MQERLCREQLWRVSASRRVHSTWWKGLPFLASMNLVFGLAGPFGSFHPAMSTMRHLDPEFLRPKEMIMAYASQVHHIPHLPTCLLPTSACNLELSACGWKPSVNKFRHFMTQVDQGTCLLTSRTSTRTPFVLPHWGSELWEEP